MLASKARLAIILRMFLIGAILLNSLPLARVSAKFSSNAGKDNIGRDASVSSLPASETGYMQRFEMPTSPTDQKLQEADHALAQNPSVLIQCIDTYCSDTNPGTQLTETLNTDTDIRVLHFKIICEGHNCAKVDVFYKASLQVTWGNGINAPWFHETASISSSSTMWGTPSEAENGTGDITADCGTGLQGGCGINTSGVIAAEVMPTYIEPYDYHFVIRNTGGTSALYEWHNRSLTVQLSLDPSFIDTEVPQESANCKGCYYGMSQG